MKTLYPSPKFNAVLLTIVKASLTIIFLIAGFYSVANAQDNSTELVFKNPVLLSGKEGKDKAVYKFPSVMTGIDALVTINDRSSDKVSLVNLDLSNTGFDKAFQPQVTYGNNTSPAGNTDWWMEFQITFVNSNTSTPAVIDAFNVSGLDIDGNNDKISEYDAFYGLKSFVIENGSALVASSVQEKVKEIMTTVGERFDGPVTNYTNIDTLATTVMVTNSYVGTNSFRVRAGAKSTGVSGAADRMYSFWFKTFTYDKGIVNILPVTLVNWTALLSGNNVSLKWSTTMEKNASHFILERSTDGVEFSDAAMVFAAGNSAIVTNYSFTDKLPANINGTLYYRLKMVDMDGRNKTSDVRIVRTGKSAESVKVMAYPNPVVNELRITVPQNWQGKTVSYQLAAAGGQVIKSYTVQYASQTEVIAMSQVPPGIYILRVVNGTEAAVQTLVKAAR